MKLYAVVGLWCTKPDSRTYDHEHVFGIYSSYERAEEIGNKLLNTYWHDETIGDPESYTYEVYEYELDDLLTKR